jgi:hypothetical protein
MIFEYLGYTVHCLGLRWYWIIGHGFLGYETDISAAQKTINGIVERQCTE